MDFNRVWQHWHDFDKPRLALGISLGFESSSGCMVLLRIVTVCLSVSCSEKGKRKKKASFLFFLQPGNVEHLFRKQAG